jgi:tetratricopeptide (TPR) repeat protein
MTRRLARTVPAALAVLSLAACAPGIRPLVPVMENGEVVASRTDEVVGAARLEGEAERERLAEQRAASTTAALAACAPAVCEAVARGELAIGMTEAEVLAATRTTAQAWDTRSSEGATLMAPRSGGAAPSDAVAKIAFVAMRGGRVSHYTYQEAQGFRTVASPEQAGYAGRSAARAVALRDEGDEYAQAGRLDLALERYDQADVLSPGDPETTLRIATTLDKSLRPIEAIVRYQLFIHQLELEKINARGDAAAKIAEAIARAHERIVVIENR